METGDELSIVAVAEGAIEKTIRERADKLEKPFGHWGFADFLAWGYAEKCRVFILLNSDAFDVFEMFMPTEMYVEEAMTWTTHAFLIACYSADMGEVDRLRVSDVNHFVSCVPLDENVLHSAGNGIKKEALPTASELVAAFKKQLYNTLQRPVGATEEATFLDNYMSLGWAVNFTVCNGDCAPHSLASSMGLGDDGITTFIKIRRLAAASMRKLAPCKWFADALKAAEIYEEKDQGSKETV